MTLNELLALLGRAWSRLLIYPGGITAFAALWLIALLQSREPSVESYQRRARAGSWSLALGALVPPWLGLALLPLPPAATLSRQTDLIVALALLEWPLVLAIARELRSDDSAQRAAGVRRLAAALSFVADAIGRADRVAERCGRIAAGLLDDGDRLLTYGFAGPALAWMLSPAAITALLWGCGRLTAGRAARWWARVYLGLDLVLLLALLWAAYQALQRRLS